MFSAFAAAALTASPSPAVAMESRNSGELLNPVERQLWSCAKQAVNETVEGEEETVLSVPDAHPFVVHYALSQRESDKDGATTHTVQALYESASRRLTFADSYTKRAGEIGPVDLRSIVSLNFNYDAKIIRVDAPALVDPAETADVGEADKARVVSMGQAMEGIVTRYQTCAASLKPFL